MIWQALDTFMSWICLGFALSGLVYYLYLIIKVEWDDWRHRK